MSKVKILNLKPYRDRKGVTQAEIANFLGVTPKAVNFYELGEREPNLKNLVRLADYFGVSTDELLGRNRGSGEIAIKMDSLEKRIATIEEVQDHLIGLAKIQAEIFKQAARGVVKDGGDAM